MSYTRAGRPSAHVKGRPLIVEDLNMEGSLGKIYSKAGRVPKFYFQIRGGVQVLISKEEYEKILEETK